MFGLDFDASKASGSTITSKKIDETKRKLSEETFNLPDTDISILKQSLLENRLLTYLFIYFFIVRQEGRIQCHTITRYMKIH